MPKKIAIIYNDPVPDRYGATGETQAILGVLDEVSAVEQALTSLGHSVTRVPLLPPMEEVSKRLDKLKADVIFNLFEGFDGRTETEAQVAAMLAEKKKVYTGCPASALELAQDKLKSMQLMQEAGIPVPDSQMLRPETLPHFRLSFPCIVKPAAEHASHGMSVDSVVHNLASLIRQVTKISESYGGNALVQEFLAGREFNMTVMGNETLTALPLAEVIYSLPDGLPRILTFASKWDPDSVYFQHTQVTCPTENVSKAEYDSIVNISLAAYKLLGCSGYARIDLRMDQMGQPHIMEINPNPDISPEYGAARQAKNAGMSYEQFIEKIVMLGMERK